MLQRFLLSLLALSCLPMMTAQAVPLYRISRGPDVAYLLGTVHVGAGSAGLSPAIATALQQSSRLVLELDVRDQAAASAAVDRFGTYANGERLDQHLAPATLARLRAALHRDGIPLSEVQTRKPWLVANWLAGQALARDGWQRSLGTEFRLLRQSSPDTPVQSLESPAFQLAQFDSMDAAAGEAYLRDTLNALDDGSLLAEARVLLDAARTGDMAAVDTLLAAARQRPGQLAAFTRDVLLGKRNATMAQAIAQALQSGQTPFIGVGLLHLVGPEGLLARLTAAGYRVEALAP